WRDSREEGASPRIRGDSAIHSGRQAAAPGRSRMGGSALSGPGEGAGLRYLCTGGAGFLGSAVVRALVERGDQVVVLDDFSRGRPDRLAGLGCEAVEADVRNAWDVTQAAQGCDA